MSLRRFLAVFRLELGHNLRRPLVWVLVVLLALIAWGLAAGNVQISSGSSDVGGPKAYLTSEFAVARTTALVVFLLYTFFVAIAAGMVVVRDEELKVGAVLHSTPLTAREYAWGKFLGVVVVFAGLLVVEALFHAIANHGLTGAKLAEYVGPFALRNYLRPALLFGLPLVLFVAGTSFAVGALARRPILVFVLPVALFLVTVFFLLDWSPSDLDPRIDRALGWIEPSGFRWLNLTWLEVDRGTRFYNEQPIGYDLPYLASRAVFALIGLGSVAFAARRIERRARGVTSPREAQRAARSAAQREAQSAARRAGGAPPVEGVPETRLQPTASAPVGLLAGIRTVGRAELRELARQPGLYLFVPLILLQVIGTASIRRGAFDTPLLETSGLLANGAMNTLTLLVCLLLLFYTVESLERERACGLAPIHASSTVKSISVLFGKVLANGFVGVVVLVAAFLGSVIVLLVQGRVRLEIGPFVLLWGLLLLPTFVAWSAFVAAAHAIARGRYGTYAIGLAAFALTGWCQFKGWMTWAFNWNLWSTVSWSDMARLEFWRTELVLNRIGVLGLAVFLVAFAVQVWPRRQLDAVNLARRLRPRSLLKSGLRLLPYALVPLVCGIALDRRVDAGWQGEAAKKRAKDYWRKNVQTYKDAPLPAVRAVRLALELWPSERRLHTRGSYLLENDEEKPLREILVTPGWEWRDLALTLDGAAPAIEDRAGLRVLRPAAPLAPGARTLLGFEFTSTFPDGATKNGRGADEFVLDAGVVLTSFRPSFAPLLGWQDGVGVDEENRSDAKEWADDFYVGLTHSGFGADVPFPTHIEVTVPDGWRANSVGELVEEREADGGRRTFVWESDHPVTFFNVVAGRWVEKRGEGTVIYHHPAHAWNVDEMSRTLDAARKRYSEWFYPFPWKELKVSEFPALGTYGQGFPTDITFSEALGFLTRSDPRTNVAFLVTAHESAHQWWGNLLNPGDGPGANILSEGLAHFSTILLFESELGLRERIEFCKRIESQYGDNRQVDSERPLVKIDGSRAGDTTVTYDKGGWVTWMLLNHMGREPCLAGLQAFLRKYEHGPDHPVLQDLVADMRPFAPDAEAYDAFTHPWFFEVVVPEYRFSDATRTALADGAWEVRARLTNAGTGRMSVEVVAARGVRFPEPDQPASATPVPYEESRATYTLGAGESTDVVLRCGFEPQVLDVDPDALVLQLRRKDAIVRF